jgi:CRISPR-associated protein Csx14
MAEASIPVDLLNPSQVFACLGFMEAAEILLGDAEGGFDWSDGTKARFVLRANGERNPFEEVLEFLADAKPERWGPIGYVDPPPKKGKGSGDANVDAEEGDDVDETADDDGAPPLDLSITFPARVGDRMALPIKFGGGNRPVVELNHWTDDSSRNQFKLYAGNRSADAIARAMLKGVRQLWENDRQALVDKPFDVLTPMGGSFNFDPRGAWTAIDAGYSPNEHKHAIQASPVVEFLAAWGMENARPLEFEIRQVRYAVWGVALPLILARAALTGSIPGIPSRQFHFELDLSGKNKVVTFAREEIRA